MPVQRVRCASICLSHIMQLTTDISGWINLTTTLKAGQLTTQVHATLFQDKVDPRTSSITSSMCRKYRGASEYRLDCTVIVKRLKVLFRYRDVFLSGCARSTQSNILWSFRCCDWEYLFAMHQVTGRATVYWRRFASFSSWSRQFFTTDISRSGVRD